MVANLISGIVSASGLGPSGRGVIAALGAVIQLGGLLFSMGVAQSLSYFIARRPDQGPRLLTTWMLMLLPCCLLAVVLGEVLLRSFFVAHNAQAVSSGRWFLVTLV